MVTPEEFKIIVQDLLNNEFVITSTPSLGLSVGSASKTGTVRVSGKITVAGATFTRIVSMEFYCDASGKIS